MVKVCDSIMGSGKTSAAITYMNEHPEEKFIYVTPYLTECDRVKDACPALRFTEPSGRVPDTQFSKVSHLVRLIERGKNIVTTHAALKGYPIGEADLIREKGYTLILDECLEVMDEMTNCSDDLRVAIDAGLVRCEGDRIRWVDESYDGELFKDMRRRFTSVDLFRVGKEGSRTYYYWIVPPVVMKAFKDVYIMTYMFSGQSMCYYFQVCGIQYEYIGVRHVGGRYSFSSVEDATPIDMDDVVRRIHVLDNNRLNNIGKGYYSLSMNWYRQNPDKVKKLKGHLRGFFEGFCDAGSKERLWSTYKNYVNVLRGAGYVKSHLSFNVRALNTYRSCTALAYTVNLFRNAVENSYFSRKGIEIDEDAYALSVMLQWIWRSAIRDGNDIMLYIPSERMRNLLLSWMKSVSAGGVERGEEEKETA